MKLTATPTIESYFKFPDPYKDANDCVSHQGCGRIDRRCYHQNVTHQHASDHGTNPFSVAISFTEWGKGTARDSVGHTVCHMLSRNKSPKPGTRWPGLYKLDFDEF